MKVKLIDLPNGTKFKLPSGETAMMWRGLPEPFNCVIYKDEYYDDEAMLRQCGEDYEVDMATFSELVGGDHFELDTHKFIKLKTHCGIYNCVNLETGEAGSMGSTDFVTKI